jgi:hypothetical protein
LREGAEGAAEFKLEPDPDAQVAPAVAALPPASLNARPHNPTPMYVAFGASAAGLAVGLVSGGLFLSKRSELQGVCNADGKCQSSQTDTLNQYNTFGTISVIGYGVAVAGAGVGLALWLSNRDTGKATPAKAVVVHPYVGLGSVGAVGSF